MAFKTIFKTALTDVDSPSKEELGVLRVEHDSKFGERWFRYVQNRSGGALNADALVMLDGNAIAPITVVDTSGATFALRGSGSFITAKMSPGDILVVVDDQGAAGAAPEGEISYITRVQALRVDFLPALSAILTAGDTISFIKRWSIIAAAAEICGRHVGIPMANIADGSCGWMQTKGIHPSANVVGAGTAIVEGARLGVGAALLTPLPAIANNAGVANDINEVTVARALQALTTDTVKRKIVVDLQGE
jgi:hypothetical protein